MAATFAKQVAEDESIDQFVRSPRMALNKSTVIS